MGEFGRYENVGGFGPFLLEVSACVFQVGELVNFTHHVRKLES